MRGFLVCSFFTNGNTHKAQQDVIRPTIRDGSILEAVVLGAGLGRVGQSSDQSLDLPGFR